MPMTIRDVARRAGVGSGTVSRVLNDSPKVDPHTRARVLQAIVDLDYRPSAAARRLSTGRTDAVGVVAPFMTRTSAVERLRGIAAALATTDHDMVVFNVEVPDRRDAVIGDLLRGDRVDGMILLGTTLHRAEVAAAGAARIPVVLLDAHHPRLCRVVMDDLEGGRIAARHLLELGHRRIAFLGDLPRYSMNVPASRIRHRGVRDALHAAGLELPPRYTAIGEFGPASARDLATRLLRGRDRPTGIVCASDLLAIGAVEAARALGMAVPGDVSVVGYDDLEIAGHLGLTTIRQPLFESGVEATRLLLERLEDPARPPVRAVVGVELVVRTTTGVPRV